MKPDESIVPVFGIDDNNIKHFLGTGTFVEQKPFLVTAYHVIKDWTGKFVTVFVHDLQHVYQLNVVIVDPDADLAVLEAPGCQVSQNIAIATTDEFLSNQQIVSFEYSTTRTVGKSIHLAPATCLGNITRMLNMTDKYGKAGDGILELSFPALRGASGSPILSNSEFQLLGIVIANVEYHLLPTQI